MISLELDFPESLVCHNHEAVANALLQLQKSKYVAAAAIFVQHLYPESPQF